MNKKQIKHKLLTQSEMKKHLKCSKINQKTTTTTTDLLPIATSEYKKKKSQLHNENIV